MNPFNGSDLVRLAKRVKVMRHAQQRLLDGDRSQIHVSYLRGLEKSVDVAVKWVFDRQRADLLDFALVVRGMRIAQTDFVKGERLNIGLCRDLEKKVDRAIANILRAANSAEKQGNLFDTPAMVVAIYSKPKEGAK